MSCARATPESVSCFCTVYVAYEVAFLGLLGKGDADAIVTAFVVFLPCLGVFFSLERVDGDEADICSLAVDIGETEGLDRVCRRTEAGACGLVVAEIDATFEASKMVFLGVVGLLFLPSMPSLPTERQRGTEDTAKT